MAPEAQGAHVGEVAFAAAFDDGYDVVGVPQVAAAAPLFFKAAAGGEVELAFVFAERFGVEAALRANAVVAGEDLLTEVGGIGAQLPLVDAGRTAERETAARDSDAAPAARAALARNPTAGFGAEGAHTRNS